MNKQYISEAFDMLNRRNLNESTGYEGWDFVEQVAQEEIGSGDYKNKADFVSSTIDFLKGSIEDLDKDDIKEIRTYLKQLWDEKNEKSQNRRRRYKKLQDFYDAVWVQLLSLDSTYAPYHGELVDNKENTVFYVPGAACAHQSNLGVYSIPENLLIDIVRKYFEDDNQPEWKAARKIFESSTEEKTAN